MVAETQVSAYPLDLGSVKYSPIVSSGQQLKNETPNNKLKNISQVLFENDLFVIGIEGDVIGICTLYFTLLIGVSFLCAMIKLRKSQKTIHPATKTKTTKMNSKIIKKQKKVLVIDPAEPKNISPDSNPVSTTTTDENQNSQQRPSNTQINISKSMKINSKNVISLAGGFIESSPNRSRSSSTSSSIASGLSVCSINNISVLKKLSKEHEVDLKSICESIGRAVNQIAVNGDKKKESYDGRFLHHNNKFNGTSLPACSMERYLWRIVDLLNQAGEPCRYVHNSQGHRIRGYVRFSDDTRSWDKVDDNILGRGLRCLLLGILYIDRLVSKTPRQLIVTTLSIHRLILVSVYIASKYTDDCCCNLQIAEIARIGGVTVSELKKLELDFCSLIQFDLFVGEYDFSKNCLPQLSFAIKGAVRYRKLQAQVLPPCC